VDFGALHHIWREDGHIIPQFVAHRNPQGAANGTSLSKQTFIFKKFKKTGKKDMKVVTNGELWCILIVNLGAVYS
jgi:hypothetical protein